MMALLDAHCGPDVRNYTMDLRGVTRGAECGVLSTSVAMLGVISDDYQCDDEELYDVTTNFINLMEKFVALMEKEAFMDTAMWKFSPNVDTRKEMIRKLQTKEPELDFFG